MEVKISRKHIALIVSMVLLTIYLSYAFLYPRIILWRSLNHIRSSENMFKTAFLLRDSENPDVTFYVEEPVNRAKAPGRIVITQPGVIRSSRYNEEIRIIELTGNDGAALIEGTYVARLSKEAREAFEDYLGDIQAFRMSFMELAKEFRSLSGTSISINSDNVTARRAMPIGEALHTLLKLAPTLFISGDAPDPQNPKLRDATAELRYAFHPNSGAGILLLSVRGGSPLADQKPFEHAIALSFNPEPQGSFVGIPNNLEEWTLDEVKERLGVGGKR